MLKRDFFYTSTIFRFYLDDRVSRIPNSESRDSR